MDVICLVIVGLQTKQRRPETLCESGRLPQELGGMLDIALSPHPGEGINTGALANLGQNIAKTHEHV